MAYDTLAKQFTGSPAMEIRCWCSIAFAIPRALYEYYDRKDGAFSLHCPLGHGFVPSKSSAQVLRDQIARETHLREQAESRAATAETLQRLAERMAAARKGQVTKIRNRIKNGVCPCCQRSFVNLARHMQGQHPTFGEEKNAEV